MKVNEAVEIIRRALENPVQTWLDYTPQGTPLVVFDDDELAFLNHPDPPSKRPETLAAATAQEINGVMTATIPLAFYGDEQALVTNLYHECFHVYQKAVFHPGPGYDFFEVLAFYPEMNPAYRALCSAETEVVNNSRLPVSEQAAYLSALTQNRHEILSQHVGLLDFEKELERNEGTASYVEGKARAKLYGESPDPVHNNYGYSRQYFMGNVICRYLEHFCSANEWQQAIQQGASLTEFLLQVTPHSSVALGNLELLAKEQEERQAAEMARAEANEKIEALMRGGVMRIKLPQQGSVSRAFSPRNVISFGDGRLIHPEFVMLQMPNGQIAIQGDTALEDYRQGTLTCRAAPYQILDGTLEVSTDTIQISLSNVRCASEGEIEVL